MYANKYNQQSKLNIRLFSVSDIFILQSIRGRSLGFFFVYKLIQVIKFILQTDNNLKIPSVQVGKMDMIESCHLLSNN